MNAVTRVREIEAKSILRKSTKIDSWFLSRYSMNLYRGCAHNCVYCDGRAEQYYVEGEFSEDVAVKVHAADVLAKELDPARKRKPMKTGFILLGGGVGDSYQPAELQYQISRKILEQIYSRGYGVHILTESTNVKRDRAVLRDINSQSRVIVSFSFSSTDDALCRVFEPGTPPPSERLRTIESLKGEGFYCGMYLMPVIPYVTDTEEMIRKTVADAKEAGVDFIMFGGLTLKQGRQQDYFYHTLNRHYPQLVAAYQDLYKQDKRGHASDTYYNKITGTFISIAQQNTMAVRIPLEVFRDVVEINDLVVVILEHIDYLLKARGVRSAYGYAAYLISQLQEPLGSNGDTWSTISGLNKAVVPVIREILQTRNCAYYQHLVHGEI